MDILKLFFGDKKKRSLLDENGFTRLQTEEMDAVLGGRPIDHAGVSFDLNADLTTDRTTGNAYSQPENRH